MIKFTQDNINELTDYILKDQDLSLLAAKEDWKSLFNALYMGKSFYGGALNFLYHYFLQLDNFNVLTLFKRIPGSAFMFDDYLTSLDIPDSVTSIEDYAFQYCSGLTAINYYGTKAQWDAILKGNNWDENTGDYTIYCSDGDIKKK